MLLELFFKFDNVTKKFKLTSESTYNLNLPHNVKFTPITTVVKDFELLSDDGYQNFPFDKGIQLADFLKIKYKNHSFTMIVADDMVNHSEVFDIIDPHSKGIIESGFSFIPEKHIPMLDYLIIQPKSALFSNTGAAASSTRNGRDQGLMNLYSHIFGDPDDTTLRHSIVHEFGHLIAQKLEKSNPKFWDNWKSAIFNDKFGISLYGLKSKEEDFAEAYLLYSLGGKSNTVTRSHYKKRFSILDNL